VKPAAIEKPSMPVKRGLRSGVIITLVVLVAVLALVLFNK
jgi:hypothetical protein